MGCAPSAGPRGYVHTIALNVLRGVKLDISFEKSIKLEGQTHTVHFDNASHSSGKQRAYVTCRSGHCACFKYRIVEKFLSCEHATA